ncbi:MAG: hypothetical protein GX591_04305 [Planctomycetes bacterium]|nr:hypothetical protein [Planctomycetota bacterium]
MSENEMPKTLWMLLVAFVLTAAATAGVAQVGGLTDPGQSLGNLTVTGQVTGGFAFRGTVPYAGVNELRLRLPSETIDTFGRDAMSLERLQSGNLYGPQPYTPPSRATYMLRQAARSTYAFDPVTGSVTATGGAGVILPRPQQSELVRDYAFAPILSQEDLARVVSRSDRTAITPVGDAPLSAVTTVDQDRPGTSALFGMIQETQRQRLAETMLELKAREDQGAGLDEETDAEAPADEMEDAEGRPENTFADLLTRLARTEPGGMQPGDLRPGAAAPSGSLEQLDTDPSARPAARQPTGSLAVSLGGNVVVRDLAGTGGGLFNRYMSQGDDLLRAGRFYQAASAYSRAQLIHEFNPLAALGAGLAYLGAGESHRASYQLGRGVRLFPDLVQVRIDLDALVGAEVIDRRAGEVRDLLGETVEPGDLPLVFLLTFIHANRGNADEARRWASELAPLAAGDSRLADYAAAILGGEPVVGPADAAEAP